MKLTFKQKFNAYLGMSKRNILVFFRDKSTVFFSMLAPLIVLFLYLVFLKGNYVDMINANIEEFQDLIPSSKIDAFINLWLLSGILGTSCITVSLNSLTVMVEDKMKKIDYDYTASPCSSQAIILAYFTGAFVNTFLIGMGVLTIGLVIMSIVSEIFITFASVIMLILTLFLGCASATLIMMIVVSFFKKSSALGAFSGIVSAGVGFLIGAYMPVSEFSTPVQIIANILPGSHVAAIFRNYLMSGVLDNINLTLGGVDGGAFSLSMKEAFAFRLNFFTYDIGVSRMFIYIVVTTLVALLINILFYKFSSQRK